MEYIGIGIYWKDRNEKIDDFFLSLRKAIEYARAVYPQISWSVMIVDEATLEDAQSYVHFKAHFSDIPNISVQILTNEDPNVPNYISLQRLLSKENSIANLLFLGTGLVHYRCIEEMLALFYKTNGNALIEAREIPLESPREYNPKSLDNAWCSKACMLVPKKVYTVIEEFDERLQGLFDDVDYSWRAKHKGFQSKTCPNAWVYRNRTYSQVDIKEEKHMYLSARLLAAKWGQQQLVSDIEHAVIHKKLVLSEEDLPDITVFESELVSKSAKSYFKNGFWFSPLRWAEDMGRIKTKRW